MGTDFADCVGIARGADPGLVLLLQDLDLLGLS